ncbi:MAG: hypothetical protein WD688_11775 [Candidatus Binatia bacterium]
MPMDVIVTSPVQSRSTVVREIRIAGEVLIQRLCQTIARVVKPNHSCWNTIFIGSPVDSGKFSFAIGALQQHHWLKELKQQLQYVHDT